MLVNRSFGEVCPSQQNNFLGKTYNQNYVYNVITRCCDVVYMLEET